MIITLLFEAAISSIQEELVVSDNLSNIRNVELITAEIMAMRGWNRQLLFFISFIMLSGLYILVSMNKGRKIQHKRISVVNISVLSLDRVATIKDPIVAQPIIVFPEGNKGSQNGSFQPETLKRAREPLDENSASESDRDPKEQLKFSKRLPRGLNVSLTQHHEPIRPINLGSLQQQQSEERHRHSTRISLNTVASAEEQGDEEPSQKRRYYIEPTSIKSKPLSHDHVTEVLLVMVSKKEHHFAAFLRSLKRSDWPRDLLVVFSHDFYKSRTVSLAAGLKTAFRNTVQWFHPFACSEARPDGPGRGFPRYHLNGSEIFDWKGCCVKNHWWWAINKIWSWLPSLQILYYFEEDFLVAKNSYKAATMLRQKSEANNLFGFMLQCRHNLWTVSGGLLRSSWLEIQQKVDFFCSFNEYNW